MLSICKGQKEKAGKETTKWDLTLRSGKVSVPSDQGLKGSEPKKNLKGRGFPAPPQEGFIFAQ